MVQLGLKVTGSVRVHALCAPDRHVHKREITALWREPDLMAPIISERRLFFLKKNVFINFFLAGYKVSVIIM